MTEHLNDPCRLPSEEIDRIADQLMLSWTTRRIRPADQRSIVSRLMVRLGMVMKHD